VQQNKNHEWTRTDKGQTAVTPSTPKKGENNSTQKAEIAQSNFEYDKSSIMKKSLDRNRHITAIEIGGAPKEKEGGLAEEEDAYLLNEHRDHLHALQGQFDKLLAEVASQKNQSEMLELVIDDMNRTIDDQDDRIRKMNSMLESVNRGGKGKPNWEEIESRLRETEERLEGFSVPSLERLKARRGQLEFRMIMMMDRQANVEQKLSQLPQLLPASREPLEETISDRYSPEIIASITKQWVAQIMEVAKALAPASSGLRFCEAFFETENNTPTASAAAAAILNLARNLVNIMASASSTNSVVTPPRAAIRLYSAIYPTIRSALIDIGRLPGPTCLNEQDRQHATANLRRMLELLARSAEVAGLTVSSGEPFLGLTDGEKDRWLPEILIGERKSNHHCILLSSSSTPLVINLRGTACRHSFIVAWRNFFMRKYPSLGFRAIPVRIMYIDAC
jgi:hypothetical protein